MENETKFTPDRWTTRVKYVSIFFHLLVPALALILVKTEIRRFAPGSVFGAAYCGYLVFAIVLHKEYFPESFRVALRLVAWPLVFAALAALLAADADWFYTLYGALLFTGLEAATVLVFFAGSRLAAADPQAAPGESRLTWRADGRSFWSDPHLSPMARWTILLAFFLPGAFVVVVLNLVLWRKLGDLASPPRMILVTLVWIIALIWTTRLYVRQLVNLTVGGRFFGPGRRSFS